MFRFALDDFDGAFPKVVQAAEPGLLHVCLQLIDECVACIED
jgi:hypothetical protein